MQLTILIERWMSYSLSSLKELNAQSVGQSATSTDISAQQCVWTSGASIMASHSPIAQSFGKLARLIGLHVATLPIQVVISRIGKIICSRISTTP